MVYDDEREIDFEEGVDKIIKIKSTEFEDIWDDLYLGYKCKDYQDVEVEVSGDDVDSKYSDDAELSIDGKEFETVKMTPEEPDIDDEIKIYVEDRHGDPLEYAYIRIYNLGDDDEWDEDDKYHYERTDVDGEAIFTLKDEFEQVIGKYIIVVVESKSGGDYCRWTRTFTVKRKLTISEIPADIRAGEEIKVRVVDSNNNSVAYADVTISGAGGFRITDSTDTNGYAYLTVNNTGSFSMVATKEGYEDSDIKNFDVKPRSGLNIEIKPEDKIVNNEITIGVTSNGKAIENADVKIKKPDGTFESTKKTSSNGEVKYIPNIVGVYEVEVSKETYEKTTKKFIALNKFTVTIPDYALINENIPIIVNDQSGKPVRNAIISINGKSVGNTDINGKKSFKIDKVGKYTIGVTKDGFKEFSKEIIVKGILSVELSKKEINLGEKIKISVKDINNKSIEADITIDRPDGKKVKKKGIEYIFRPEIAGDYKVVISREGYSSSTLTFKVLPYRVDIKADVVDDYLVITVKRNGTGVENLSISVVTPKSEELIMYTDDKGTARLDLDDLNERGNFTISVADVNYESDIIVRDIEAWGGLDLLSIFLIILILLIIILSIGIVFVYIRGKGIGTSKVEKPKTTLKRSKKNRLSKV